MGKTYKNIKKREITNKKKKKTNKNEKKEKTEQKGINEEKR